MKRQSYPQIMIYRQLIQTQTPVSHACESGYGRLSYIRLLNESGQVHCALLIGKSRVAPLKFVSILKLELTAAVKISKMLKNVLDILVDDEIFLTDIQ